MARAQFTFTFTNAQPGADVGFNFPAFADSSTTVADGTLVLDSTNSVSVWADAAYLIAHTVDGRGVQILGVATSAYPTQTIDAGVPGPNPFPSGGSTPGTSVVRKFSFAYNTPGLVAGHAVYTPTIGDVLIDAWIEVETAWDGTTPGADVGTAAALAAFDGWFGIQTGFVVDMTKVDSQDYWSETPLLASAITSTYNQALSHYNSPRRLPAKFTAATPICVTVNNAGADPGATQGAAALYLVTATPA